MASLVWLVAVLAALILAAGALVVALDFNRGNGVVSLLVDAAGTVNVLGEMKSFEHDGSPESRQDAGTRSALVNWGVCALVYLVLGKILDRLIRPQPPRL